MASGETHAPALGISSGYGGLRRRLVGLTRSAKRAIPLARWLLALALPLLLPWRLTAAVRVLRPPRRPETPPRSGYRITDLGDLTDGDVAALNDAGQVAGTASGAGDTDARLPVGCGPRRADWAPCPSTTPASPTA